MAIIRKSFISVLFSLFIPLVAGFAPPPAQAFTWQQKSDMVTSRTMLAGASLGSAIYATGGYHSAILASAEVFLPASNSWNAIADLPLRRLNHAAVGYDGKLYLFGGQWRFMVEMGEHKPTYLTACTPVAIYDPASNTWSSGASMPTPRAEVRAAELNGEIWVIGGLEDPDPMDNLTTPSTKVEIYNPITDSWRNGPSLPYALWQHSVASLDGKIYVSGGWTESHSAPPAWNESYTLLSSSGSSWTAKAGMPYRRRNHAMVGHQGHLFVLGGIYNPSTDPSNGDWYLTDNAVEYDPLTNSWSASTDMPVEMQLHIAAEADGTIFFFGGSKDQWDTTAAGNLSNDIFGGVPFVCPVLADLNVAASGKGAVFNSPGIACGDDCTEKYCIGMPITLTAVADAGYEFVEWTGACAGTTPSCDLEMNSNLNVGAVFSGATSPAGTNMLLLQSE